MRRWVSVALVASLGIALALFVRRCGPAPLRAPTPVELGATTTAALDTLDLRAVRPSAALAGYIVDVEPDGAVVLADAEGHIRVRFRRRHADEAALLRVGDRLFVRGPITSEDGSPTLRPTGWGGPQRVPDEALLEAARDAVPGLVYPDDPLPLPPMPPPGPPLAPAEAPPAR